MKATRQAPTVRIDILIAGDLAQAKQICRQWCMEIGDCVTVEAVDYVYKGGEEAGVRVGFINYPRFPRDGEELLDRATRLAERLMLGLCQLSFSVVAPETTYWFSRREDDAALRTVDQGDARPRMPSRAR